MKKIILLVILSVPLFTFAQHNGFKYKGEVLDDFMYYEDYGGDFNDFSYAYADAIPLRNRIYVMFDENSDDLLLNGHEVTFKEFEAGFKYVLSNPDERKYLPESIFKAVIFSNLLDPTVLPQDNKVLLFQAELVLFKMVGVYSDLKEIYMEKALKTTWEKLTETEVKQLKEIKLHSAIYVPQMEYPNEETMEETFDRNVLNVHVNAYDILLVRDKATEESKLGKLVERFITNPNDEEDLAESPKKATIVLSHAMGASEYIYKKVEAEVKATYALIWDRRAIERYGLMYKYMNEEIQAEIREAYPINIIYKND